MPFTALLDANVLWSAPVRDTLVRASGKGLYQSVWTLRILGEVAESIKRSRPDLDPARIDRMIGLLVEHFPRALVDGYEELVDAMRNHEGDRHVLAAAVHSGAGVIVTWNRTHFPQEALAPYSIEVQTPDEFLCHLWYLSDDTMAAGLVEQAAALRNPPVTTRQLVETLSRSVPEFARVLSNSPLLFP